MADPDKLQFVLDLGPTASTTSERRAGYDNDLAQFAAIDSLGVGADHRADADRARQRRHRPAARGQRLRRRAPSPVPGSITLDGGSHLAFYTHPDATAAQQQVIEFLLG